MIANYHTHTKRCRHAVGEDREYVEAAIGSGIQILGFADHCPWVFRDDYVSTMRMTPAQVDGYFYSLESLKKEYEKDIRIYIGLESEYCAELLDGQTKLLEPYPLDYMIMGQHFLGVENYSIYSGSKTTDPAVIKTYVDMVQEGLSTEKYLYVAHPDLLHFVGDDAVYRQEMKRLCETLKEKDIPIEINLLGFSEGRHYPSERFLSIAEEVGNKAILGVDAHSPQHLRNQQAVREAEELCKKFHLPLVDGDLLK